MIGAAQSFKRSFTPFRRRYAELADDLFGGRWRTADLPLTDDRIEAAIFGRAVLAYLCAYSPRALGVDIDDHAGQGPAALRAKYDAVRARFGGLYPSVVCLSPRGLHAWWFITWPMPTAVLHGQAEAKLHGLEVELRPTPTLALRIPHEGGLVDPGTLLPVRQDFQTVIADAPRYHPAELFNPDVLPAGQRANLAARKRRAAAARYSRTIAEAEAELYPILPGATNDALTRLVPLYRGAGLTEADAALRFAAMLAPFYAGELRDGARLRKRVHSFYLRAPDPKPRSVQRGLFTAPAADAVARAAADFRAKGQRGKRALRRGQVEGSCRRLAAGIIVWVDYIAAVRADPRQRGEWNYLYPYFAKNTREGLVPLPRATLRRIDANYSRHLPYLVGCGFLAPGPYAYVPGAGICRYYRVDLERFTGPGGG